MNYKVIKEYNTYYLMENEHGIKECFLKQNLFEMKNKRKQKEPTFRDINNKKI
jgi:hypothetical protein